MLCGQQSGFINHQSDLVTPPISASQPFLSLISTKLMMEALGDPYAPAIALDGWNYMQYLGPFTIPPPGPVFLCLNQEEELVVATGREPSKLWHIVRLHDPEDDVNRHACSFKHESSDRYIDYQMPPSEGKEKAVLGSSARFDVFRITRMKKPSYIRAYQAPPPIEECCDSEIDDAQTPIADPSDGDNVVEMSSTEEAKPQPAAIEWYLGISADLKVVIKPFPPMSECSEEMARKRPVWELTSREEAIRQDYPSFAAPRPPVRNPRLAKNPMFREFYLEPDRFEKYDRDFWPKQQRRS